MTTPWTADSHRGLGTEDTPSARSSSDAKLHTRELAMPISAALILRAKGVATMCDTLWLSFHHHGR